MQICLDVDVALAEVPVNLMPLVDDTDFKTIETAVAYNAAGMALQWNFVTSAGAMTATAVTPTTAGTYDWAHQAGGMYSIEIPASGGASINNDTEGYGWFSGVATGVLPWRGPVICFRAAQMNDDMVDSAALGVLKPTTAGRTLDVSATGEAGLDWANIGSPTTAVNLSATNIDVDQVVASVSGAVGSVTGAVGSVTGAVGSVTGAVGSVTGAVGSVASGGISEASFATTAGSFAPLGIVDQGTAQSATSTTLVLRSAAALADDTAIGATLMVLGSTQGYWQAREVTDYVSSTDTATVDAWTVTPSGTITYKLFAGPPAPATAPSVNVVAISGDTTAADNAEAFFDGTGYAGTNNVIPTVTTVNGLAANVITAAATATDFGTEVGTAVWATTTRVLTAGTNLNDLSAAQVNAEVLDVLNTDTFSEPGQGAPGATVSLVQKIGYLYKAFRNRHTQTATTYSLYADDATTVDQKATVADDGTTFSRTEIATGP